MGGLVGQNGKIIRDLDNSVNFVPSQDDIDLNIIRNSYANGTVKGGAGVGDLCGRLGR